jgi:hypothetical protein
MIEREMPEVAAPFIRVGQKTKVIDQTFRDAQAAAEQRIEQAVAMTPGASKEDFSEMKLTNYKSNMVEGEPAVNMPQPSQEFMQNVNRLQNAGVPVMQNGGMQLTGQAPAYSAATRAGIEPNAGARAMNRVRSMHASQGHVTTSNPALETQQPGYVPRT